MSCSNPGYIEVRRDPDTGSLSYQYHRVARFLNPSDFGSFQDLETKGFFRMLCPCRHCLGCRIDYARSWANRLLIELDDNQGNGIFVTLTYNNESVPFCSSGDMTLKKRDYQLFFKRLRKRFSDRKIRYFLCGEYGKKNLRPHYHAIIFGLSLTDFPDLSILTFNELGHHIYTSKIFADIWQKGYISLAECNYLTCSYCARYILKKHYGADFDDFYPRVSEFVASSRSPGIGMLNYDKYILSDTDHIVLASSDGVHSFGIPSSFTKKGRYFDLKSLYEKVQLLVENGQLSVDEAQLLVENGQLLVDKSVLMDYYRTENANGKLVTQLNLFGLPFDDFLRNEDRLLRSRISKLKERL